MLSLGREHRWGSKQKLPLISSGQVRIQMRIGLWKSGRISKRREEVSSQRFSLVITDNEELNEKIKISKKHLLTLADADILAQTLKPFIYISKTRFSLEKMRLEEYTGAFQKYLSLWWTDFWKQEKGFIGSHCILFKERPMTKKKNFAKKIILFQKVALKSHWPNCSGLSSHSSENSLWWSWIFCFWMADCDSERLTRWWGKRRLPAALAFLNRGTLCIKHPAFHPGSS